MRRPCTSVFLAGVINLLGAAGAQPEQSPSTAAFRQLTSRVGQWIAVYWDCEGKVLGQPLGDW